MLIDKNGWPIRGEEGPKIVAFGGGHGLSATLLALKHLTSRLTAVVTVADDGGSSGRLRQELDCLPPGDLRMALSALCEDSNWGLTWRDALQYRFETRGELQGHSLGNLLIAGLWQISADPIEGLDWVVKLLRAKGRVLPMSLEPLRIWASYQKDGALATIGGQKNVALLKEKIEELWIEPEDPAVPTEVLESVDEADWLVLGPGSWYTSVIAHLLVPKLNLAICNSKAKLCLVLNLGAQSGETENLTSADHLAEIAKYAPGLNFDVVIADPASVDDTMDTEAKAKALGAQLILRQVRQSRPVNLHDPLRLAAAFRDSFEGIYSEVDAPVHRNKEGQI